MRHSIDDIAQAVASVVARYDVQAAYVFGSFARGEETPESDIDIRLECGSSMRYSTLREIQLELERALGCAVDIVTCRPEHMRPRFRERVLQDEVKLFEAA